MKKKIAWITDSTSGLNPEEAEKLGIHVLPLSVIFGEYAYRENIDITNEEFYKKLESSKEFPTSSQPTIGDAISFYEKLKEEYDMGIAVHISSQLSGTYENSLAAANMVDFPVVGIDSKTGADALVSMIKTGQRLLSEGRSVEEVEGYLNEMANHAKAYLLIGSLEQVAKGGRVSNTQALIGNLLKINLIIKFEDGRLVPSDKIRTTKKARAAVLQHLFNAIENSDVHDLSIVSTTTPDLANEWSDIIVEKHNCSINNVTGLSPVIGVHGGAGTIGLFWFEK